MANAIQDPLDRLSTIIEGEKSPFVQLTERMKETSKDVKSLNLSILDLAIALEKRAGGVKEKVKEDKQDNISRPLGVDLKADFADFTKGFVSTFTKPFKDFAEVIAGKPEMPANVEKPKDIESNIETISPDTLIRNNDQEEKTIIEENKDQTSKVLSDMVEVLIDLRDDKSQKQLLGEAIAIKKLITDQTTSIKLPGGIEPNTEESKQEDREKLAEAIARKLSEVMEGIGSNSGLGIPDLDIDKNKKGKSGKKTPNKLKATSGTGFKIPPGAGKATIIGGSILGGAGLALGAYEASEFLDETDYGGKMKEGAGLDAEKAFRENVAPTIDPVKAGVSKDEAIAALENGSKRDIEKLGGVEELRKIAGLSPVDMKPVTNELDVEPPKKFEQASLRKYDYVPEETSPKVTPKKEETKTIPAVTPKSTENNVGKILDQVSDENTELKMFNMGKTETQMLAPIVSQQTINNTEQTMLAATPIPHSTSNSFNKWQDKRSSYTD